LFVQISPEFELVVEDHQDLIVEVEYSLNHDESHRNLTSLRSGSTPREPAVARAGRKLKEEISSLFGRSLAIRDTAAAGHSCGHWIAQVEFTSSVCSTKTLPFSRQVAPRHVSKEQPERGREPSA
jgi:hypothetical protein